MPVANHPVLALCSCPRRLIKDSLGNSEPWIQDVNTNDTSQLRSHVFTAATSSVSRSVAASLSIEGAGKPGVSEDCCTAAVILVIAASSAQDVNMNVHETSQLCSHIFTVAMSSLSCSIGASLLMADAVKTRVSEDMSLILAQPDSLLFFSQLRRALACLMDFNCTKGNAPTSSGVQLL
jgi:hypothetical protein